jgi:hypothetical protein
MIVDHFGDAACVSDGVLCVFGRNTVLDNQLATEILAIAGVRWETGVVDEGPVLAIRLGEQVSWPAVGARRDLHREATFTWQARQAKRFAHHCGPNGFDDLTGLGRQQRPVCPNQCAGIGLATNMADMHAIAENAAIANPARSVHRRLTSTLRLSVCCGRDRSCRAAGIDVPTSVPRPCRRDI